MAAVAVQDGSAGIAPTYGAAAAGDTVAGGVAEGGWHLPVVLLVRNADATTTDVTVAGLAAVTVPATTGSAVIPVRVGKYGDPVAVTYSKTTSLTVAAVRLTSPLG
jgi:hypothetical protein